MRPLITRYFLPVLLSVCLITTGGYTQTVPDGIIFQAIAKDPSGVPAKNRTIYIKDMILQGGVNGTVAYSETFVLQASADGVFTIVIGKGTRTAGASSVPNIDWGAGPYFLNIKAAIEPTVPTPEWKAEEQYVDMGTSQFWTQPFAFMAARVAGMELMMKLSDTTAMLAPYLRKSDTLSLSNRIDNKLNLSDTTLLWNSILQKLDTLNMLKPYMKKGDTTGLSVFFRSFLTDTTSLSNRINSKLGAADTVSLSNRINNKLSATDTLSLSSRINGKLGASDTVSLSNRINNKLSAADTLSLSNRIDSKLGATDTLSLSSRINSKLGATDTLSLSSRIDNLANRIDAKINTADTANMLSGYLRIGNLPTLPIGPGGSVTIDTAAMLAGYQRKFDTAFMLSNYALRSELGGSASIDTAAMLAGYQRKLDTAFMLSNYALKSELGASANIDTAAMLAGYLRKLDTAFMLNNYVRKSDLAAMPGGSGNQGAALDTAAMLAGYLRKTDTTALLASYYKRMEADSALALKESAANKSTDPALGNSDVLFPTQNAVKKYVDSVATANVAPGSPTVPDASATDKGKIKLAGDLTGTADEPLIADGKITSTKLADTSVTYAKIQNVGAAKLLGNPSGVPGAVSEITLGPGLSFSGNTLNISATGGGSGGAAETFTSDITVYSANGLGKYGQGQIIPAIGKTAAQVLIDALTQAIPPSYSQPSVSIGSSPSGGTFEIGTALSITLSSGFNANDGGAATGTVYNKGGSPLGGNTDNIASLTSSVSYTVTISYGQGPVKNNNLGVPDPTGRINAGSRTSSAVTFTPQSKRFWGYSADATPTDAEIRAALGGNSELSGAKAKGSFDVTISSGSNYVFYAYPASLGGLSSLSVGGFGSLPAFDLTTRSFTNAQGHAQSYNIYVSKNTFSSTVSNIITN